MKLLITAGGGGHFAAALAVISILPKDIVYVLVGRKYAFEADKTIAFEYAYAKEHDIPYRAIPSSRLQRHFNIHSFISLSRFPKSFFQAFKVVKEEKPDVILSFGGYTAVPVVLAAALLRIPIVIHEQTLNSGLANSIAAQFAKTICLSWGKAKTYFPKQKTVVTGNPLRFDVMREKDFFNDFPIEKEDLSLPILYITGGSLGSHAINELISGCLEKLVQRYVIIHQTGAAEEFDDFKNLEMLKKTWPENVQKRYILTKFVQPQYIGSLLENVDLVIARAGINTVSEMLYFGKPTLFIPLPVSHKNEQMENALFFKKQGLGEVFSQDSLTSEKLYEYIVSMVTHKNRYMVHAKQAKQLLVLDAANRIIAECEKAML